MPKRAALGFFRFGLALLLVTVFGFVTLQGVSIPRILPISQLYPYQVAVFPTGIALYQHNTNAHYYSFSPLNDFTVDQDGHRHALISPEQFALLPNQNNDQLPWWKKLELAFLEYQGQTKLTYSLAQPREITYQSTVENDQLTITHTLPVTNPIPQYIGSTITIDPSSFVFESSGVVLTATDSATMDQYAKLLKMRWVVTPTATNSAGIQVAKTKKIYILTPNQPGILEISAAPQQVLFVNTYSHLIEILEPTKVENNHITTQFNLQVKQVQSDLKTLSQEERAYP